jgi:hypothetical protein
LVSFIEFVKDGQKLAIVKDQRKMHSKMTSYLIEGITTQWVLGFAQKQKEKTQKKENPARNHWYPQCKS